MSLEDETCGVLCAMSVDYLYQKPPLIEVIAEIHWSLKKIDSAPQAHLDPYYDVFREQFLEVARSNGLVHVQELIPSAIPIELVSSQPQLRLRSKANAWPLLQIGPGILTANIVPPYDGWAAFEPFLGKAISDLFQSYPLADRTLNISGLHLRYIDGFDDSFGFEKYEDFAKQMLGIERPLSDRFVDENIAPGTESTFILENVFQNKTPVNSTGRMKLSPGQRDGKTAAIMELQCDSRYSDKSASNPTFISEWFAEAHKRLRKQFETIKTDELEAQMGKKKDIV
jgi:uncharacterized protein (TIGR04255 family)